MDPHETKIYLALLVGIFVLLVLVAFFIVNASRYQRRLVAAHEEKINGEIKYLDEERERIAVDLHDDFGASLSAIKITLRGLKGLDTNNLQIVENSESQIDQSMKKLRRISFNMLPETLQRRGLNVALQELISLLIEATGIIVNYQCDVETVDREKSKHIYRIAQEILNNTTKYAVATRVNFTITRLKQKMVLHINDNGIGFNKIIIKKKAGGLGLHSIFARAVALNATIYLTTSPGEGVDYLIEIPN